MASAKPLYTPGEVLFSLKAGAGKIVAEDWFRQLDQKWGEITVEPLFERSGSARGKPVLNTELGTWYRLRFEQQLDPVIVAGELDQSDLVEYAQPNYLRREAIAVDDSLYAAQWNLAEIGWEYLDAGAFAPVVVAIVDSGLDYSHPDILGQLWINEREENGVAGVDDDGNGYVDDRSGWDFSDAPGLPGTGDYLDRDADPMDESGHGTHVAGIVAAATGNGRGIAGVAPRVRLMILRAGFNLSGGGYLQDDDIAAALAYAAEKGARVVNMSWGSPTQSPLIEAAVQYAAEQGLVLVAAAGNEGSSEVFYPARSKPTIAVGASARGGSVLSFSNYGPSIDLVAPGHAIWSLAMGGGYVERSGTSMAAAHVAGIAALVLDRNPHLTPVEVRGALTSNAIRLRSSGSDPVSGAGIAFFAAIDRKNPAWVQIANPNSGVVPAGEVAVELQVNGVEQYELSWGLGSFPRSWSRIASGSAGTGKIDLYWDTGELEDGTYQLRLRGVGTKGWLEDRVELQLLSTGPEAREVRLSRGLDGHNWIYMAEWETAVPAAGVVALDRDGEVLYRVVAPPVRRKQRIKLPADIGRESDKVWVRAGGGERLGPRVLAGSLEDVAFRVDRWAFKRKAILPDGYLMSQLSDFNGDGRGEVVLMGYGGGRQYNAGDFYQLKDGVPERIFTSLQFFIPWGVQDVDGDGIAELMAVDSQRVRLLESASQGAFPERLIWEEHDLWGGEVADLDEDGLPELFLRSGLGPYFQVFESSANDEIVEIEVLNNPGTGTNELGQRQVIGDFDGDGRGEVISGDMDGDLFAYERVADNAYRSTWQEAGDGDTRIVGGGFDLDGDGGEEFVVARFINDRFDVQARRWEVEVYSALGDNLYTPEWQIEVMGGQSGGSGIGQGDLDGDGTIEWVLLAVPNLYVFRSDDVDRYEPVWHVPVRESHRPLVGDLDGDGLDELLFNGTKQVEVYSLAPEASAVEHPAGFVAYPLNAGAIGLEWQAVAGAIGYRVVKDGEVWVKSHGDLALIDEGVEQGQAHAYRVAALTAGGMEGPFTAEQIAVATAAPQLVAVQRLSSFQLGLEFSTEMRDPSPYRFRTVPDLGPVETTILDRNGQRIVLSFANALPDTGLFELEILGLRSKQGGPLSNRLFPFVLSLLPQPARPVKVEVLSPTSVEIHFDKSVSLAGDFHTAFAFTDTNIRVLAVREMGEQVVLELASPLRPLGRSFGIRIANLRDADGLAVEGAVSFRYAADDLAAAFPFPNPYRPGAGALTFGFLSAEAEVAIFDGTGRLVCTLVERDGDGGVQWDGRNQAGEPVGSGVYLYRISNASESQVGKVAVLRD